MEKELKKERPKFETTLKDHNAKKEALAELQRNAKSEYDRVIRFDRVSVAMQFEFQITENNNATAQGSITWPITFGTFTLGWSGGKEKRRVSDRDVQVVFPFSKLVKQCEDAQVADRSWRARPYPITGNIGMAEFMNQYFRISDRVDFESGKEAFRDTLTFTTTIKKGATPNIELAPAHPSKVSATIDLNADRKDIHVVTVAVYPADKTQDGGASPTTVNIGSLPEVNVRVARDPLEEYVKKEKETQRESPRRQ